MSSSSRFDRYEILAPLGEGGMGEVVKARALGPHGFEKVVAIKRIRAEWAQQEVMAQRFIREARIAARLHHANIVQVFDFGRHGDELFIVMEFVDGQSLEDILAGLAANGKRPTLAQTLQVALDVTRALDSAHHLEGAEGEPVGIIHRDVSPANVLVSRQGVVKLVDFGIAAVAVQEERASLVAGKPMYMAPEQLRGDPLDPRCDLFAVGLLLYEMLTGQRPWKGMVDASAGATLASMGYEPPSRYAPEVPAEVDELVARLLAPDREARFESAAELAKAIVKVSYASQIVLDPSELRPLVGEGRADAHAPTQPSSPSQPGKVQTLIATISPDGLTVLAPGSVTPAVSAAPPRARGGGVLPVALLLGVLGAGGIAFAVFGSAETASDQPATFAAATESPPEARTARAGDDASSEATDEVADEATAEPSVAAGGGEPAAEPVEAPAAATLGLRRPERPAACEGRGRARGAAVVRGRARPPGARGEAPAEAAGEPGLLDVWSSPWARIYVDGALMPHSSPHRGIPVASGRRVVRLHNPELGLSYQETVYVPPGGRALVRAELRAE
ncbi:MAG: protein kinase [Sandaracinaceae bacterium]|nr:protein kinase [Sandaracinaceae bacterium]